MDVHFDIADATENPASVWPATTFTPCSPKHKSCSPAHADLVNNYRTERHRQWLIFESETALLPGDITHWKAFGGHTVTFYDWLKAHKR